MRSVIAILSFALGVSIGPPPLGEQIKTVNTPAVVAVASGPPKLSVKAPQQSVCPGGCGGGGGSSTVAPADAGAISTSVAYILLVTVHQPAPWNAVRAPGEWRCQVSSGDAIWDEACHQKAVRFATKAGLEDFLSKSEVADGEVLAVGAKPQSVTQKAVYRPVKHVSEEVDHYQVEFR